MPNNTIVENVLPNNTAVVNNFPILVHVGIGTTTYVGSTTQYSQAGIQYSQAGIQWGGLNTDNQGKSPRNSIDINR